MIKIAIFDFDGTLADTLPFYTLAYKQALIAIGVKKTDKEVVGLCFGKKEDVVCKSLGLPDKTALFSESYFTAVETLFKKAKLFPDTLKIIQYLRKKNIKIAIVTFAYRWYIDQMITQFNLNSLVDLILSTEDVANPKPNPESVYKVSEHFKVSPTETIVVGDSTSDILMAKNAGSKSVLMFPKDYNRYYNFLELKKTNPDFIIQELSELTRFI